jgi:hypothetical protein
MKLTLQDPLYPGNNIFSYIVKNSILKRNIFNEKISNILENAN